MFYLCLKQENFRTPNGPQLCQTSFTLLIGRLSLIRIQRLICSRLRGTCRHLPALSCLQPSYMRLLVSECTTFAQWQISCLYEPHEHSRLLPEIIHWEVIYIQPLPSFSNEALHRFNELCYAHLRVLILKILDSLVEQRHVRFCAISLWIVRTWQPYLA